MILYHGSNVEITEINFNKCKPYKDFGKGFYGKGCNSFSYIL